MGKVEAKLIELGLELPAPLELPSKNRTSAVQVGHMLYVSGHGAALLERDDIKKIGKVTHLYGLVIESVGPDVCVGEICEIFPKNRSKTVMAEVVGIKDNKVLLMPYADLHGIDYGSDKE